MDAGVGSSADSSVDAAIEAAAFVQAVQRDLNCLSDPDRNTRKKALGRLDEQLVNGASSPKGRMLQIVWDETIFVCLVKCLHDAVEKCREATLNLINKVVKVIPEAEHTCRLAVPVIAERIGQIPVLEPSEELRLGFVKLLIDLTSRCSIGCIREVYDPLCSILCLSLGDSFHEVKKASCQLLSGSFRDALEEEKYETILKALIPNVTHPHSRVRLAVLSALDSVVLCGLPASIIAEFVAPGVKAVAFDRSEDVRKVLFASLARWLGYACEGSHCATEGSTTYLPQLLPLLLLGITDESSEIRTSSLPLVEGVGNVYEKLAEGDQLDESFNTDNAPPDTSLLPPPFEGWPSRGSRLMVQSSLRNMMRVCITDLQDWTLNTRLAAARLVQTSMVYAGHTASTYLDLLIPLFCSAVGDDQVGVAKCIIQAAHILALGTQPQQWIGFILDPLVSSQCTTVQRANNLVILAALLFGAPNGSIQEDVVVQIAQGLLGANLFPVDSTAVRSQLFAVLNNLVVKGGTLCKSSSKEILVLLVQLLSAEGNFKVRLKVRSLMDTFATTIGLESSEELFAIHISDLICQATAGHEEWRRHMIQTVLLNAGALAGPYLNNLLPVFAGFLQPERDPALRISFLQLLDELFEIVGLEAWWTSLAKDVIQRALIPCGVWLSGKVGAAVRHATMVALGTFLRRELCSQADMLDLLKGEEVLPVVASCLEEDFYVDTRRASCHVIENILQIAGNSLRDDHRAKIAGLLQKRLDDSSDDVRLGILRAFFSFFSVLPLLYNNMEVRGLLNVLVLHMDDQNLQIREAVCRAVEQCALRKPAVVVDVIKDARNKHQSTQYCDYLLTVAASVQTREYIQAAATKTAATEA